MMNYQFARIPWDGRAADDPAPAMAREADGLAWLANQVFQCLAMLVGVYADGRRVGSLVVRFEVVDGVREFVVVAAGGSLPGVFLYPRLLPEVCDLAQELEADQVRCHGDRPGIFRWLERGGFYLSESRKGGERVYRKVLA